MMKVNDIASKASLTPDLETAGHALQTLARELLEQSTLAKLAQGAADTDVDTVLIGLQHRLGSLSAYAVEAAMAARGES